MIFKSALNRIKCLWQRMNRGWSDEDVWDLFAYNARTTYEMLLCFKATKHGYPATLNKATCEYDYDEDRWNMILDKIIYAYKLNVDIANGIRDMYNPENKSVLSIKCLTQSEEMNRRIGMMLFMNYYFNFWD